MPSKTDERVTLIGRTNFRDNRRLFGIRQEDRFHHMYVIGKTGTGKSTLLEAMIRQDIEAGSGVALLDPHGDLVEHVAAYARNLRPQDLIDFNVPDTAYSLGFNPLERVEPSKRVLAALGMLDVFKKIWLDSWGPRLEHILRNALLLLFDQPEATLADVLRLLDDSDFRKRAAGRTPNAQVRSFWLHEYESYSARFRAEAIAPIQNKVGAFLADPLLRRILTERKNGLDLRRVMDEKRVLLVNLSKGKLGEDTASLLGALIVSQIGLAALSRADIAEDARRDFFVYLDEFQSFTTLSLATMLSELRKYRVGLVLGHQYLAQVPEPIQDAVLGNVGTMAVFRVGPADAEVLEGYFQPEFRAADLMELPNYSIYLRLMVSGRVSRPFSANTVLYPRSRG
jgi:Helicase HerA, central domain